VNEAFIKICKVDENLHISMRFKFRSIFDDDNFVCLHRYLIEIHSKIKKICQAHRDSIVYLVTNRRISKKWKRRMRMWELIYSSSLNLAYQF
jgi:hypothetical protein